MPDKGRKQALKLEQSGKPAQITARTLAHTTQDERCSRQQV